MNFSPHTSHNKNHRVTLVVKTIPLPQKTKTNSGHYKAKPSWFRVYFFKNTALTWIKNWAQNIGDSEVRIVNFVDDIWFIWLGLNVAHDHLIFLLYECIFLPYLMSFKKIIPEHISQNIKTIFIIILEWYVIFHCATTGSGGVKAVLGKIVAVLAWIRAVHQTLLTAIVLFNTMYSQ